MTNSEEHDDTALVTVVAVPHLLEAERVATALRTAGIPAILDPEALDELRAGGYRDLHRAFPILVPKHYEAEAVTHLDTTLHRPQGSAGEEAVLAGLESDEEALPAVDSRRHKGLMLLFLMLALVAFGLYALLSGGP